MESSVFPASYCHKSYCHKNNCNITVSHVAITFSYGVDAGHSKVIMSIAGEPHVNPWLFFSLCYDDTYRYHYYAIITVAIMQVIPRWSCPLHGSHILINIYYFHFIFDYSYPCHCYAGHSKVIMSIAWEPAHMELPCRRFVTASQDGTAKVWDANTRRCFFTLSGHTRPVTCVKWGGDGFIHTSSRDGSIMVWDAKVFVIIWQSATRPLCLGKFWCEAQSKCLIV